MSTWKATIAQCRLDPKVLQGPQYSIHKELLLSGKRTVQQTKEAALGQRKPQHVLSRPRELPVRLRNAILSQQRHGPCAQTHNWRVDPIALLHTLPWQLLPQGVQAGESPAPTGKVHSVLRLVHRDWEPLPHSTHCCSCSCCCCHSGLGWTSWKAAYIRLQVVAVWPLCSDLCAEGKVPSPLCTVLKTPL